MNTTQRRAVNSADDDATREDADENCRRKRIKTKTFNLIKIFPN